LSSRAEKIDERSESVFEVEGSLPSVYSVRRVRAFSPGRMTVKGTPGEAVASVKLRGILRLRLAFRFAKARSSLRMTFFRMMIGKTIND